MLFFLWLQLVQFSRIHVHVMFEFVERMMFLRFAETSRPRPPPQHNKYSVGFTGLALWVYATLVVLGGWVGSLALWCINCFWPGGTGSCVWKSKASIAFIFCGWTVQHVTDRSSATSTAVKFFLAKHFFCATYLTDFFCGDSFGS